MDSIENDNFLKNDNDEFDTMKILINIKEEKYLLRIFPSKDKVTLTFKLEEEKIQTYYYIETFDLRDFRQKNKLFLSDDSIPELFSHLKEIRKNCSIELEKKIKQINVCFKHNFDSKFVLNFTLMKYIVSQKNLNPILVELIQENKAKIKMLKRQIAKLNKAIQAKTDIINDFNNNIASINNSINNITNSNNANKNEEEENNKSDNNNKDDEEEELITKENTFVQTKEPEEKRYISNNRKKKNKKQNKKIKLLNLDNNANNNKNNQDNGVNIFCFENMEILGNKKLFELLVIFNIVTIIIILCLLGSIYSIKSDLEYEKVVEEDFINKLAYLNAGSDYNDDEDQNKINNIYKNKNNGEKDYKNSLFENENQEIYFKEEILKKGGKDVKEADLQLKFYSKTEPQGFAKFYNNCNGIKECLILVKNNRGKKFAVFSRNLCELLHGDSSRDFIQHPNNFILYSFNINDILEYSFKNLFDIYLTFVQSIFKYLSTIDKTFQGKKDLFTKNYFTGQQLLGNIMEIEIYQVVFNK